MLAINSQCSQNCTCVTQEAHPASDGKVDRCSEGEAQGVVDSRDRTGAGHPSGHGEEVHGGC